MTPLSVFVALLLALPIGGRLGADLSARVYVHVHAVLPYDVRNLPDFSVVFVCAGRVTRFVVERDGLAPVLSALLGGCQ